MEYTNNKIELKRGVCKICHPHLSNIISDCEKFESFYENVFLTYNVAFDTKTIRQKRNFVVAVTKYFILDRLPKGIVSIDDDGDYNYIKGSNIEDSITDLINRYYEIHDNSESNQDFMKKYAEYYNEEVRDFSLEISQNRDDSLSDFARVIEKIHNYQDDKKST